MLGPSRGCRPHRATTEKRGAQVRRTITTSAITAVAIAALASGCSGSAQSVTPTGSPTSSPSTPPLPQPATTTPEPTATIEPTEAIVEAGDDGLDEPLAAVDDLLGQLDGQVDADGSAGSDTD